MEKTQEAIDLFLSGKTSEPPISQAIRDIKCLNLTKWGQIILSQFPDQAIKHACFCYKQTTKQIKNPWSWFYSICRMACEKEKIPLDKEWSRKLALAFKMPNNNAKMTRDQ